MCCPARQERPPVILGGNPISSPVSGPMFTHPDPTAPAVDIVPSDPMPSTSGSRTASELEINPDSRSG